MFFVVAPVSYHFFAKSMPTSDATTPRTTPRSRDAFVLRHHHFQA